ncbi:MAG: O-antigen ligase family protein [Candidatus Magasanikbacteria bacterium]|nr:O-antigen ligase family protein [Candidatus Magasanikbacteria bacterium]
MFKLLLVIFFILFAWLTTRRILNGLLLIVAFLPSYLLRFQLAGVPITVLEGMILITTLIWIIQHRNDWKKIGASAINGKLPRAPYNRWFAATLLLLIATTVSIFVSTDIRAATGIWKAYFIEPLLFFSVFISTVKTDADKKQIVWALLLGTLPITIFAIIQKFTGWLIPNPFWQAEETRRVTGFFNYPNAVALYVAPLLPLTIYLWNNRLTQKILLVIIIVSGVLAIIFAQSTGALIALAGTAILFGLINKKMRLYAIGAVIIAAIIFLATPLKQPFANEVLFQGVSGQLRLNMWGETVEMLKTHPILGAGLANYQTAIAPWHILKWAEIYLYPHNIFITFWSETGIFGLIAFICLIILFFKKTIFNRTTLAKVLVASMLILLIHGLVDVPYFKNDLAVIFWTFFGLAALI